MGCRPSRCPDIVAVATAAVIVSVIAAVCAAVSFLLAGACQYYDNLATRLFSREMVGHFGECAPHALFMHL